MSELQPLLSSLFSKKLTSKKSREREVGAAMPQAVIESETHRIVWVGKDAKDHLVTAPCCNRDTFH